MRSTICLSFCLLITFLLPAQETTIIPQPAEIKLIKSEPPFKLNKNTKIVSQVGDNIDLANYLRQYIADIYGIKLQVIERNSSNFPKGNYIDISDAMKPLKGENAYSINVNDAFISLVSYKKEGLFNGLQTLIQLLPTQINSKNFQFTIPCLQILDYPRFAYRGMHLDVSRHFFPVSFIKKYIDYLALYKFNTFHWHLTDDQGWRIEIKKYPKLTSVGAWRNGTIIGRYPGTGNDGLKYGGYYTQQEIKEVVKYAAERYITIIP
jgi:hexosaminidase